MQQYMGSGHVVPSGFSCVAAIIDIRTHTSRAVHRLPSLSVVFLASEVGALIDREILQLP